MKQYLGIDIGGTFIKYAIITETFEILKKWKKETIRFDSKDEFYDYLCTDLPDMAGIEAIGVSAPGIIHDDSTVLSYASKKTNNMYQSNINLEVGLRTNKYVTTMNDAKAAGYCEFKLGNGKNTKSSVYYVIGTGIGGCVCDANGVIDGKDHLVGEFSYLPVGMKENGDLKMHTVDASMDALVEQYNAISIDKKVRYGTEISTRYHDQEPEAMAAVDTWLDHICMGLVMLTILYNPEIICIGGGVSEEDWFIAALQDRYQTRSQRHFVGIRLTTKIDRCLFHSTANVLGAVLHTIESR